MYHSIEPLLFLERRHDLAINVNWHDLATNFWQFVSVLQTKKALGKMEGSDRRGSEPQAARSVL